MSETKIDDEGLRGHASSIKDMKLTSLDLFMGGRNIGDEGLREIASSITVMKLTSLILSMCGGGSGDDLKPPDVLGDVSDDY